MKDNNEAIHTEENSNPRKISINSKSEKQTNLFFSDELQLDKSNNSNYNINNNNSRSLKNSIVKPSPNYNESGEQIDYNERNKSFNGKSLNNQTCTSIQIEEIEFQYERLKYTIPKRLDNLPYSRFHTLIIVSLGISWILDGYEVSLLSVLSGVLESSFKVKEKDIGLGGTCYLLGCVIGSLFFGFLASIYGRRTLFNITLIIYGFSIIMTSFALNFTIFLTCRFFTGIAVGGEYSSIFAAIDELIPPRIRGRADLIIDGTWHFGSFLASLISYISLNYINKEKENENLIMRILFSFGAISIIPVIYMRRFIPESPRWLIYQGQYKEALKVLEFIEDKCYPGQSYKDQIKANSSGILEKDIESNNKKNCNNENGDGEESSNLINVENSSLLNASDLKSSQVINNQISHKKYSFKDIFVFLFKIHRTRFFYSLILMASQAFFYNGIFYTYSLILQNFYHIDKKVVGIFQIPLSVASFIGPILFGKYFDSWSRRKMIALTFVLSGILLIVAATNFLFEIFGMVIQQIIWFCTFLIASPAASSAHLTVSEIFPIEMRSQAMAIFFSMGLGIGGVVSPFFYGWLVSNNNKTSIFYSYLLAAFVMIFAGVFGYNYGVDSENKSLENIANLGKEIEFNKKETSEI